MSTTYDMLAQFAQFAGTIYLFVFFLGVLAYALWPANKKQFNAAARIPLRED